jgi:hypothetical protein
MSKNEAVRPGPVQAALKGAEGLIGPGIPYGLIRNSGQPPGTSDRDWVNKAKRNMEFFESVGLEAPSQNIFSDLGGQPLSTSLNWATR